jgi:Tfp pilus assembly protein PilF
LSPRFCRAGPRPALFFLALACLFPACSRTDPPAVRMAVLRFENLTGDASLDWMGRALSEILASGASGSRTTSVISLATLRSSDGILGPRPLTAPGVSAERTQALAAGANRLVYGEYSIVAGRLHVAAMVEDPVSGKIVRAADAAGRSPGDLVGAAEALALRLGGLARPFATADPAAWRHYAEGLEQGNSAAALQSFEQAAASDPGFGHAWLAAIVAARAHPAAAPRIMERALASRDAMHPIERARLDLEAAAARGDAAGQRRALAALVEADPADPGPYHLLASVHQADRDYSGAAALLRTAVSLHPENPALLNSLGYAEAWAGNLKESVAALRRYRQVRPEDANALDSLGDVHLHLGKPAEAERYYLEGYAQNPGFQDGGSLLKAAFARLMAEDAAGAGPLFDRYLEARRAAGDPLAEYRHAEWLWLTGQRAAALEKLAAFSTAVKGAPDIAARAHAHLTFWKLETGDATGARAEAEKAAALAGPGSAGIAALARFLAEPAAPPSEWAARAERRFAQAGETTRQFALGCALLFGREFEAAVPVLKESYARWAPGGEPAFPVLLAWAHAGSGRPADAAPLVERNPIPPVSGLNPFTSLWFPRLFALRGQVLEAQGNKAEAARHFRRFLDLSGPSDTIWGDARRARAALEKQ